MATDVDIRAATIGSTGDVNVSLPIPGGSSASPNVPVFDVDLTGVTGQVTVNFTVGAAPAPPPPPGGPCNAVRNTGHIPLYIQNSIPSTLNQLTAEELTLVDGLHMVVGIDEVGKAINYVNAAGAKGKKSHIVFRTEVSSGVQWLPSPSYYIYDYFIFYGSNYAPSTYQATFPNYMMPALQDAYVSAYVGLANAVKSGQIPAGYLASVGTSWGTDDELTVGKGYVANSWAVPVSWGNVAGAGGDPIGAYYNTVYDTTRRICDVFQPLGIPVYNQAGIVMNSPSWRWFLFQEPARWCVHGYKDNGISEGYGGYSDAFGPCSGQYPIYQPGSQLGAGGCARWVRNNGLPYACEPKRVARGDAVDDTQLLMNAKRYGPDFLNLQVSSSSSGGYGTAGWFTRLVELAGGSGSRAWWDALSPQQECP